MTAYVRGFRRMAVLGLLLALQWVAASGPSHAEPICAPYPESSLPLSVKLLQFPAAWARVCGTAYVGILDNGIVAQLQGTPPNTTVTTHASLDQVRTHFLGNCVTRIGETCPSGIADVNETEFGAAHAQGHGTHVAGLIGGTYTIADPQTGAAAVGGCRRCALQIVKVGSNEKTMVPGLDRAKAFGAQVVNLSQGTTLSADLCDGNPDHQCTCDNDDRACTQYKAQLDSLAARDVVVVAASGNADTNTTSDNINFPASHPGVIAVGGVRQTNPPFFFWDPFYVRRTDSGDPSREFLFGSSQGPQQWVTAPANSIFSLFYPGKTWATFDTAHSYYDCEDQSVDEPSKPAGFGKCSGTSMSTPQVTAIVALMRSANPLLSSQNVRLFLKQSGSEFQPGLPDQGWTPTLGFGVPSAAKAVDLALGGAQVVNRLTPLFSLMTATNSGPVCGDAARPAQANFDHLYTVVPQMAMSAIEGTLPPQPFGDYKTRFNTFGLPVPGYSSFPAGCADCAAQQPKAIVSVFTTYVNPIAGGPELIALYRMSWSCPEAGSRDASRVYAVASELDSYRNVGYVVDGIEGFIHPKTQSPQPAGTVKLCRKYDPDRDDYILLPGSGAGGNDCSATSDGYSGGTYSQASAGTDWLGYVYPVQAPGPFGAPPSPATLSINAGNGQSVVVATVLGPISVLVSDASQNPVSGVTVTFAAPASGASAGPATQSATTNASGIATASLTANTIAGTYNVNASVSGLAPVTFTLANLAGPAAAIAVDSGSQQSTPVNTQFSLALRVKVSDAYQNAVQGVSVTFASQGTTASATLSAPTPALTGTDGKTGVQATANGSAGTYVVTASVAGIGQVASFALTNSAAPPPVPQFRSSSFKVGSATAAFPLAFPAGSVSTDWLLMHVISTAPVDTPNGWTLVKSLAWSATYYSSVFTRQVGSAYNVTYGAPGGGATIAAYQNTSGIGTVGVFNQSADTAANISLPRITLQNPNSLVAGLVSDRDPVAPVPAAGFTSRVSYVWSNFGHNIADRFFPSTTVPTQTWSQAATLPAVGLLIELKP